MASIVAKPVRKDYEKKFDDFREKSFDHLEDYEIDNYDKYCEEFLKNDKDVKSIVSKTVTFDIFMLIFMMVSSFIFYVFCFVIYNTIEFINYLYYFTIITAVVLVFWFFILSPLRSHRLYNENGKKDYKLFIQYRGVITPGTSILKQLGDNKLQFVILGYFITATLVLFSVMEDYHVTPYLNLIYGANTEINIGTIPSVIPTLVVIFMVANSIGIIAILSYDKKNTITDEIISKFHIKKLILLVISVLLIIINIIIAIDHVSYSVEYWRHANPLITNNNAQFNAAWITLIIHFFVFLGVVGLAIFVIFMFSAFEGGFIKMLYRQKIEILPPEEDNWEYHKTVTRHKGEKKCFNRTRVWSAIELVTVIALAVWGYWTLWIFSDDPDSPMPYNETIYNLMILELALVILWIFIFSGYVQYRRERKYYFKDPHLNFKTVEFEERGLGSWKTYYREDLKKRKKLIAILLYFNLIGLWGLSFNSGRQGGGDTDIVAQIFEALGISTDAVLPTMLVFFVALNIFFLIYVGQLTIFDNSPEGKGYKYIVLGIIGLFLIGSVAIIGAFEEQFKNFDFQSTDYVYGLITIFALFSILGFLLVFFVFPVAIRFDNLEVVKKDIIVIMISTIVLMAVFSAFYDFFLPMARGDGSLIQHNYPFRSGLEYDASYRAENFNFAHFLIHWYGYVWWGFVQQYLFMSYFLRLLYKIFPHSKGILPAALSSMIFGIIHYPDWPLMLFTAFAGIMWAYYWQKEYTTRDGEIVRGNNLFLWGMVHGFGGTLTYFLIPISMSVGPFNA